MKREQNRIATGLDLAFCVSLSCLSVILYIGLRAWLSAARPLYVAMLTVFLYLAVLSVYAAIRMQHTPRSFAKAGIDAEELPLVLERMAHPTLLCDDSGHLLFANQAFLDLYGEKEIPLGGSVSELCRIDAEQGNTATAMIGGASCSVRRIGFTCAGERRVLLNFYNDTPRLEATRRYMAERTVVAYAIIDNLEEILQFVQDEYATTAATVEEKLTAWVESMHGLIRAYDRNKYLILFDNEHLEECLHNRFSILDEIRSIRVGDAMPITVSLGVSRIQDGTLAERERAAQFALDLALQRGGDQVVFRDGREVFFYGGKTKAGYKRVNIKSRIVARQLLSMIARAGNVLVMGHRFADYDSFAASVGLVRLVMNQGVRVNMVVNRDEEALAPCFAKLNGLPEYNGVFVDGAAGLDLINADTLLIVADVNNSNFVECRELMQKAPTVAIIDHHIKTDSFNAAVKMEYIDPTASSASELVTEIVEEVTGARILRPQEAELLLSGVLLDTKRFTRNTGTRTFAVAQFLRGAGANPGETFEFFKETPEDLSRAARFNSHVVIYRKHIAIAACDGDGIDASYHVAAAKAADGLLGVKGVRASFALVKIEDTVHISARSDGSVNVQVILEGFNGGGHFDVAGAQIANVSVESVVERLRISIDKYLDHQEKGDT